MPCCSLTNTITFRIGRGKRSLFYCCEAQFLVPNLKLACKNIGIQFGRESASKFMLLELEKSKLVVWLLSNHQMQKIYKYSKCLK